MQSRKLLSLQRGAWISSSQHFPSRWRIWRRKLSSNPLEVIVGGRFVASDSITEQNMPNW
jgi:hypothetical protein